MTKTLKELLESFDFNRAAIAKQRLQNLRHSGRRVRGASVANLMRSAGLREEEMDEQDLDQLDEVLSADASSEDWIKDFVHSTDPKFEGKSKKERIKMALGAYYAKTRSKDGEGLSEGAFSSGALKAPQSWKDAAAKIPSKGTIRDKDKKGVYTAQTVDGKEVSRKYDAVSEAKTYTGLEKEDKPGKVKTEFNGSTNSTKGETVEGWKDTKKAVKEEYDEEGNLITMSKTYQEFMEGMTATKVAPNVTRYTGGSYGNAKGAKFGNTDYDSEDLEKKDDEGSETVKRGRGRPAGAKSGARGPRIK